MEKRYFGYIRVSTSKQGNGASLPEQRFAIEAFAKRHGLTISEWFCETRTAAKTGRREFTEMLTQLKRRRVAGVIIHKVDRSARNGRDWAEVCDLVDLGIEVRFAHDDLDIRTRGGRLTADIQAVIAADFIRNNREEVKKCMYGWLKQGFYPWPAPIGYLNCGKRRLKAIDPIRGPIVAHAFELYAQGQHSLDTLRAQLGRLGLVKKDGQPISHSSLAMMLRNPFYAGTIRIQRTGAVYEGKHEPLVSRKLFDRVQAVLDGRVFQRTAQAEFPFRRLIRCGQCPRTLTAERQKGQTYYRCHTPRCRGVSVSEADFERRVVLPALTYLVFDEGEMGDVRDIVDALRRDEDQLSEARTTGLDLALVKVSERLQRLTDALIDGLIDQGTFNERKGSLVAERQRLAEAREDAATSNFWDGLLSRFELGNMASNLYAMASDAEKRDLLISLGSNFVANGKDIEFSMLSPFAEIVNSRSEQDSGARRGEVRTRRSRGELHCLVQAVAAPRLGGASAPEADVRLAA